MNQPGHSCDAPNVFSSAVEISTCKQRVSGCPVCALLQAPLAAHIETTNGLQVYTHTVAATIGPGHAAAAFALVRKSDNLFWLGGPAGLQPLLLCGSTLGKVLHNCDVCLSDSLSDSLAD